MNALSAIVAIGLCAQGGVDPVAFDATTTARILQHSPLGPPPADPTNRVADDENAARLGWALFYDTRLSRTNQVSCATCHDPAKAFSDGRALAQGVGAGVRNTPSIYNVAWQRWLYWDGRADSTWAQALQPMEGATELARTRADVVALVAGDALLRADYERAFGPLLNRVPPANGELAGGAGDIDRAFSNVGKSIAAFERKLVSNASPFDGFARALREHDAARQSAYPASARRGLALFVGRANCRLCHSGPLFSDGEFHDIGVRDRDSTTRRDEGRRAGVTRLALDPFRASGPFSDAPTGERAKEISTLVVSSELFGQVKTPSLRNVARTAPYMSQGQLATLDDVLHFYSTRAGALAPGHHGESILKPLNLTTDETADLKAFLDTLTDESLPEELRRAPPRTAATDAK